MSLWPVEDKTTEQWNGNVVPRTLLEREGHRGLGTCWKLADSEPTSSEAPEHTSFFTGEPSSLLETGTNSSFARELRSK